jgi:hypothetical protein
MSQSGPGSFVTCTPWTMIDGKQLTEPVEGERGPNSRLLKPPSVRYPAGALMKLPPVVLGGES